MRPKLIDALEKHAAGLSLPEGAKTVIDIIPAEVQHRLWLQSSFDALSGIGQSFGRGERIYLESPSSWIESTASSSCCASTRPASSSWA